ncbi:MAG TPA: hypothetical protein PLZ74_10675, partial [Kiritimatiellia bacterium]|nr:hypothetical protein [Kiritimatiellia bacterium]
TRLTRPGASGELRFEGEAINAVRGVADGHNPSGLPPSITWTLEQNRLAFRLPIPKRLNPIGL